ncbi:MAG TPA: Fe-S cluster assembly protein SufB [Candidatus Pacebacteria bacterium]|nr:Fe-S cluster assembly protein SufB [Candidatus Paceibacterota bacterium]
MSRFIAKPDLQPTAVAAGKKLLANDYQFGFSYPTANYAFVAQPGLSQQVVEQISEFKTEPAWLRASRLQALTEFERKLMPAWGADLSGIDFKSFHYYLRPTDVVAKTWQDVPADVKKTFDRLGIPEAERGVLAGVKAQYDSEVVYGSLKKTWADDGVIFLSMDEAIKQHPDLVREYFGKLISHQDNKFAALNGAVWSGGSFVYVPKGVHVKMPLQTYFRINSANAGQFERTLIIVDEGASVHYVEGCFTAGTLITTRVGIKPIEQVTEADLVLSHTGSWRAINQTQVRSYDGKLYTVTVTGQPSVGIQATVEHPFLVVRRKYLNERNQIWSTAWQPVSSLKPKDYVCSPIDRTVNDFETQNIEIPMGRGRHGFKLETVTVPTTADFFRLAGFYLAEGSISDEHYLSFSFNEAERDYIEDVKNLIQKIFGKVSLAESHHLKNHGTSVVVSSTKLARIFKIWFGAGCDHKQIPEWMLQADLAKQAQLILGWYWGDGSFYSKQLKHGFKEMFRLCTTSEKLAWQMRQLLLRQDIATSMNVRSRRHEGRRTMFTLVVGGEAAVKFGDLVGQPIKATLHYKKRATAFYIDDKYFYAPIKSIEIDTVKNVPVYNFSVQTDESYVAGGVAVHNCTAPNFSASSLHSAVVEIFVKAGARCQYTTIQNWYQNVYNLVTKRACVEREGEMIWTDFNMGSKVTMKYPGFILAGEGAKGEVLSMALAGAGQHQDTGAKAVHLAPHTSSTIISKSISKAGGRTSYRGLVHIGPKAHHSKNTVVCDALLVDDLSRTDTYPVEKIFTNLVEVQHEATVSKIGDDQLFYLMSRGLDETTARKLIVNGFVADLVRKLPLEYAVEMNRLIDMEMEGSVG